jgi:DNA-directed RNA polymerase specialized sigma24 family protein
VTAPIPIETHAPALAAGAEAWRLAQADADALRADLIDSVYLARMCGLSEYAIADACGVTRMTVRAWLGKGRRQ